MTTPFPILLATLNARYTHPSLGLRWLWANLGPLSAQAALREFQLGQPPLPIAEALLQAHPCLLGLSVTIWNVAEITEIVRTIKAVRPATVIVLGGPEASHEYEGTELFALADFLIRGEGELAFAALAREVLAGRRPPEKVITPDPPDLAALALPYDAYSDEDLARRNVYVEASRGCPFRCEFCLSSLDPTVRLFPLAPFLEAMGRLIDRGARFFRFVDRTINIHPERALAILDFFRARWRPGMQVHFEIIPDRLPPELFAAMERFPAGGLHLEAGVQTFNPEAQAALSRRQDLEKTESNLRRLREGSSVRIHADLIAGLPGESLESFAAGFDRLLAVRPHEIQVGILKKLKGTPIARHAHPHAMIFAERPPYEILQTGQIDFLAMQRLRRFARYFDLYHNSGNFPEGLERLWRAGPSPFASFMALADAIWARTGRTSELALTSLAQLLYDFLVKDLKVDPADAAGAIERDYHRLPGRREKLNLAG